MKILIVTHYFPPQNSIASLRPYSWVKYWSQQGHDVTVLTTATSSNKENFNFDLTRNRIIRVPFPYFGKGRFSQVTVKEKCNKRTLKNKLNSYLNKKGIGCLRWPSTDVFWLSAVKKEIQKIDEKWDVCIASFGGISVLEVGYYLKKKGIVNKLIYDFRDLWVDSHVFKGLFPFNVYEKYLEKKLCNYADYITVVSEPLADVLRAKYGYDKVFTILNGFDRSYLNTLPVTKIFQDDKIHILYAGSIYAGHRDPTPLFKAVQFLLKQNKDLKKLEILFIGSNVGELEVMIEQYGLSEYVKCQGFLSWEDSLRMQRDADILLFLEDNKATTDGILTGKLFEYIFSGTFIWCIGPKWEPSRIIEKYKIGKYLGNNVELIENELKTLVEEGIAFSKLGKSEDKLYVYTREYQAEKMLNILNKCMND